MRPTDVAPSTAKPAHAASEIDAQGRADRRERPPCFPSLLDLPFHPVELRVREFLSNYADEMLARLPPVDSFMGAVRKIISDALPEQVPDVQHVARRIGMSVRTLQRRLREHRTSHQQLVDQLRHDLALGYRATVSETAFVLGFSDLGSFYRAFKRWTGMTPTQYRAAQQARREPAPVQP